MHIIYLHIPVLRTDDTTNIHMHIFAFMLASLFDFPTRFMNLNEIDFCFILRCTTSILDILVSLYNDMFKLTCCLENMLIGNWMTNCWCWRVSVGFSVGTLWLRFFLGGFLHSEKKYFVQELGYSLKNFGCDIGSC